MSVFSFVLMLLLLGMFAAAHTHRPVFWLLVGPFPLAVGFTLATFLRQGFGRQIRLKEQQKEERQLVIAMLEALVESSSPPERRDHVLNGAERRPYGE